MKLAAALLLAFAAAMPAVAFADASESQPRALDTANDYDAAKKAIDRKDWKSAITSLEAAARRDPKDADIQNLLGYSYRKSGNLDMAFKHYANALQLNPQHKGAHEYVGEAYLMANKPDKAKEHLAKLVQLCPQGCEERDDLAKAVAEYDKRKTTAR
jgi:Flp pilus assembly protein TadD